MKYGSHSTAPQCFYCKEVATTKNELGVEVCKKHKEKIDVLCPIHNIPMDFNKGKKFGNWWTCWKCPAGTTANWSPSRIKKWLTLCGKETR